MTLEPSDQFCSEVTGDLMEKEEWGSLVPKAVSGSQLGTMGQNLTGELRQEVVQRGRLRMDAEVNKSMLKRKYLVFPI